MWCLSNRMTRLFRRPTALRRGNGTVEAVLVLPVLLAFSFGMVEFGQFFYVKHTIQAASRDGCRTAILSTATHAQATQAVANTMGAGNFPSTTYTLTFTDPTSGSTISDISTVAKGNGIKVTVSANYGAVGVRPLRVIPANKQIVGVTTMVKE
jgi:Flp pilus assembly protein TadG